MTKGRIRFQSRINEILISQHWNFPQIFQQAMSLRHEKVKFLGMGKPTGGLGKGNLGGISCE
jgi:hypothetical protein